MAAFAKKIMIYVKNVFMRDRFVENAKKAANFRFRLYFQLATAFAFLLLSFANVYSKSYAMMILTLSGCVLNLLCALISKRLKNVKICSISSILSCSVLFAFFVIVGGNDGFACLWVVLLPFLAMMVMNFGLGLCTGIFFQIFLIILFWTPLRERLLYNYNDQFCLRFPLFFLVTLILGVMLTISLRRSEYNECIHLAKLESLTESASVLARTDPLTMLANRRSAYESFEQKYSADGQPHCIVMGDIDCFKKINDTYGHEFGDQVLTGVAELFREYLPEDYLKSRWGGEEFLIAANAPVDEVRLVIEKLRTAVEQKEFVFEGRSVFVTITFGIAGYTDKEGLPAAISLADNRLYLGKSRSKNCTVSQD